MIFGKKDNRVQNCFEDHHHSVAECLEDLQDFLKELFSEECSRHKLESIYVSIDSSESAADKELRHIVDLLSGAFLPMTRSNLIAIVQNTDDIANACQSIARRILLEKIQLPKELHHDILEIVEITRGQLDILYKAIDKLLNNFGGLLKNKKILDDIRREESRVDNIEEMLHERIFDMDITLTEKIYYRDLVSRIGQISDIIEDLSDRMQIMLVEREA